MTGVGWSLSKRFFVLASLWLLAVGLGGCFDKRFGPDPVIVAASVETSTDNQIRILTALAKDANVEPNRPLFWYEVTQAGFNYIDDQCTIYFRELFFLNRDKDQIKAGLAAAGATTAAILGVTGASAKSIAVVAQAFGLASISTDLIAGTYLYQMPPATAQGFVKEMQLAYRSGAYTRRTLINSPSTSYHALQDYLSLCLPPTIEAQIADHIAKARVVADPATSTSGPSFGLNVVTPPPMTRPELRAVLTGEPVVRFRGTFGHDDAGDALMKFVYPNGVRAARDSAHEKVVNDFLTQNHINVGITSFLRSSMYVAERAQLARQLRLIP